MYAVQVIETSGPNQSWIGTALHHPQCTEKNSDDPTLIQALARITEFNDRVLRLVYNSTVSPPRVVSVFFDRRLRNRL